VYVCFNHKEELSLFNQTEEWLVLVLLHTIVHVVSYFL